MSETDVESIYLTELNLGTSLEHSESDSLEFGNIESVSTVSKIENMCLELTDGLLFESEEILLKFQNIPHINENYDIDQLLNLNPHKKDFSIFESIDLSIFHSALAKYRNKTQDKFTCIDTCFGKIALGTTSGEILIYDTEAADVFILKITHFNDAMTVDCVSFSPNKAYISASIENYILIWDLGNLKREPNIITLTFNSYIKQIKFANNSHFAFVVNQLNEGFVFMPTKKFSKKLFQSKTCLSCSIHPLIFPQSWDEIIHRDNILICITFGSKLSIMTYRPIMKNIVNYQMNSKSNLLFSWCVSNDPNNHRNFIKFVCSSDTDLVVYSANYSSGTSLDLLSFSLVTTIKIPKLGYLSWVNPTVIIGLTSDECLEYIDITTGEKIKAFTVENQSLTLSIRCQDDNDLVNLYRNSISCNDEIIHLACIDKLIILRQRTFYERVMYMESKLEYLSVLSLVCWHKKHFQSSEETFRIFHKNTILYIDCKLKRELPINADERFLFHYSTMILSPLMKLCVEFDAEFIFKNLYTLIQSQKFSSKGFLECLVHLIINNKICKVPPTILIQMKHNLFESRQYSLFEKCIMKLDISGIDLTEYLDGCWKYKLYDCLFYLFSHGLNDCVTPLKILLPELSSNENYREVGNTILKNLCMMLTNNNIDYFKQIMNFLINKFDSTDPEISWKYLRILINFDFKILLNILTLTFNRINEAVDLSIIESMKNRRDKLLHVLLQIIFSEKQIFDSDSTSFFVFLARQMVSKHSDGILTNKIMLEQTIDSLTNDDKTHILEKQQALLGLLQSGILDSATVRRIETLSERLNYSMICEYTYENNKRYDTLLKYIYNIGSPKNYLFDTINRLISQNFDVLFHRNQIKTAILDLFEKLIELDCSSTLDIIQNNFPEAFKTIIQTLKSPEIKYKIFQQIYSRINNEKTDNEIKNFVEDQVNSEDYIRLMCEYDPKQVFDFIQTPGSYRDAIVILIVQKYNLLLPLAVLLERIEKYSVAAETHLEYFKNSVIECINNQESNRDSNTITNDFSRLISFINRNFRRIPKHDLKKIWFELIEIFSFAITESTKKELNDISELFKRLGNISFSEMSKQIPINEILSRIINDQSMCVLPFSNVKTMLTLMSENITFEESFSVGLKKILEQECNGYISKFGKYSNHGTTSTSIICLMCRKPLFDTYTTNSSTDNIIIYWCNHSFHENCLLQINSDSCPECLQLNPRQISSNNKSMIDLSEIGNLDKADKYFTQQQQSIKDMFKNSSKNKLIR